MHYNINKRANQELIKSIKRIDITSLAVFYGQGGGFKLDATFVRDRITQLRLQKGVSEYKMSYDLGHSRGYINNISSGKTLPSMTEFFAICEYFGITPLEFFDDKKQNPSLVANAIDLLSELDKDDLTLTIQNMKRLLKDKTG